METRPYQNIHHQVIEKCKQGERSAQYELYKLYSKAMFNICYRMMNDEGEAEDVLQEAFVSAFQKINSYNGSASFGAWLKRIVVNKSINALNKRKIRFEPLEKVGNESQIPYGFDDNCLILDMERIREGIQQLPDGYRVIFSLYLLEGYDHQEIAEILDVSVSTSKSQYSRAKNKLKQLLSKGALYG
ncbi:RNA polymerase sigma factor [Xanthovirga aplysinae]|uniref:RNA polymerase sigma factor n=1 Tax=Xanthovirga aplysinae TaxID=2529853 RepID=UPI0012BBF287|nr:RNA polymerase sigma factor [Xanthovirga aplysinae]MTI30435.1 RNA polymerase sigma factor [Xanthovirga aplysinae]